MRKLIFRFNIALLCFSLGVEATKLATPPRPLPARQSVTLNESATPSEASGASIAGTVARLREIKAGQNEAQIPRAAKPLLTRLKHQLRVFISDILNSEEGRQAGAPYLMRKVLARLQQSGVRVQTWEDEAYADDYFHGPYAYGDIYGFTVEEPAGHPELRVVTTTLGICCGEDTSFYLFKYEDAEWRLVLAQEARDYDEVSGGQGLFQYRISPTDAAGDFFVVTANVTPWCSSNWQTLRYSILRVGADPYRPRTLLSNEESIFLNSDPVYKIFVKENAFTLEFEGDCSRAETMAGEVSRKHVIGYTVIGEACGIKPGPRAATR